MNKFCMFLKPICQPAFVPKCTIQTSAIYLKGHSKWQNIKHIKAANDAMRATMISKQLRVIRLAIQDGGGSVNPALNTTLRNAIDEALRRDVPQNTIQATLKKYAQTPDTTKLHRHLYEGRLYHKVFAIIAIYTENLQLTRNQIAAALKKHKFVSDGTKNLFTERGVIDAIARPEIRSDNIEDDCLEDAIECGAEDIEVHDANEKQITFYCEPQEILRVKHKLSSLGHHIVNAECIFIPKSALVTLTESEAENYEIFKEKLRAVDGFDEIYDNIDDED